MLQVELNRVTLSSISIPSIGKTYRHSLRFAEQRRTHILKDNDFNVIEAWDGVRDKLEKLELEHKIHLNATTTTTYS
jgi:hypothetical protein